MTNYEWGDIVLVAFPQSSLDQRKRRPALVMLDIGDADVVLTPITTRERSGQGDYKVRNWSRAGLLRESWVRLAKIACLQKIDITRRLGHLTNPDKTMLTALWQTLYTLSNRT
jgi:mRNA interferase MazF